MINSGSRCHVAAHLSCAFATFVCSEYSVACACVYRHCLFAASFCANSYSEKEQKTTLNPT